MPVWVDFAMIRKGRVEGCPTFGGKNLGCGAGMSGGKRCLFEWFVLLRLILGAAQVAKGGRCKPESLGSRRFGKKKGPR